MKNAYLRFVTLSSSLDLKIDLTAEKLLEIISICSGHEALTVTEAMTMSDIASPATIHRKIKNLRKAGLVATERRDDNNRTKYLVPTIRALKHFHEKGKLMQKVVLHQAKL